MQQIQKGAFQDYKRGIEREVKSVLQKVQAQAKSREYINYYDYPIAKIKKEIWDVLQNGLDCSDFTFEQMHIKIPPAYIDADLSFAVFDLAKIIKENPQKLAQKIVQFFGKQDNLIWIKTAFSINGYINFRLQKAYVYKTVLSNIIELDEKFGESDFHKNKVVLLDYSSPNIAKPIGVNNLRSTIIGQTLSNIYRFTGYSVVRINHLGDWGMQIAELIYAYKHWASEKLFDNNPIKALRQLYARFHHEANKISEIKRKTQKIFRSLENKDSELIALWKRFLDLTIKDLIRIYRQLGIDFDLYIGESYFVDKVDNIIEQSIQLGIAQKIGSTNVIVVDSLDNLPPFLLRKLDSTSLYITRDLAALDFRLKTFSPDDILYIVGNEQRMNFRQFFALAKAMGMMKDVRIEHIGFGLLLYNGKKMAARYGTAFDIEELLKQSTRKASERLSQKALDLSLEEHKNNSHIIGNAMIAYNILCVSRIKNIRFNLRKMLNFSQSGVIYIQYTAVRTLSILHKCKHNFPKLQAYAEKPIYHNLTFENEIEYRIGLEAMFFPEIVLRVQQLNSPHLLFIYLEKLAKLLNRFYVQISIINTQKEDLLISRIMLLKSIFNTIKNGLALLNISIPSKM